MADQIRAWFIACRDQARLLEKRRGRGGGERGERREGEMMREEEKLVRVSWVVSVCVDVKEVCVLCR